MPTAHTAALVAAFDDLSHGDGRQLLSMMADDFVWEIAGQSTWSGRWEGKNCVRDKLFGLPFEQFDGIYTNTALRLVEEDDLVVDECRGRAATKRGGRYDNSYCYICRFEGDQLKELIEYMDTALADQALDPPREAKASKAIAQQSCGRRYGQAWSATSRIRNAGPRKTRGLELHPLDV